MLNAINLINAFKYLHMAQKLRDIYCFHQEELGEQFLRGDVFSHLKELEEGQYSNQRRNTHRESHTHPSVNILESQSVHESDPAPFQENLIYKTLQRF